VLAAQKSDDKPTTVFWALIRNHRMAKRERRHSGSCTLVICLVVAILLSFWWLKPIFGTRPTVTVYVNARFRTMSTEADTQEALAVRDGIIIAIGPHKHVHQVVGDNAHLTIDLEGAVVLPGFVVCPYLPHTPFRSINGVLEVLSIPHTWKRLKLYMLGCVYTCIT